MWGGDDGYGWGLLGLGIVGIGGKAGGIGEGGGSEFFEGILLVWDSSDSTKILFFGLGRGGDLCNALDCVIEAV